MILFNFSVLAQPHKELGARLPEPEGMKLWRMFHETYLGRCGIVVDEDVNIEIFEHWLKMANVKAAMYEVLATSDPSLKSEKIHLLATAMGRSDWYLDADPYTCAKTLSLGIPTLLVATPYIVRPEWNAIQTPRSWDAIVDEVTAQTLQRNEKAWGNYEDRP